MLAAVSKPYEFETGLAYRLLSGRVGKWVIDAMRRIAPKQLVTMTVSEEGDLDKGQVKALRDHIWDHPAKRDFVLGLSSTVVARRVGLENDQQQFPKLALDLARVDDADAASARDGRHRRQARAQRARWRRILGAEILRVKDGTHLAAYTDPTSDDVHAPMRSSSAGPDEEKRKSSVIWVAEVLEGHVYSWRIMEAPAT